MTPLHSSNGSSPEMSLTRLAARRLQSIVSGQLSPEVREKVVVCLVDYHGAVQTGLSSPWSAILIKYASTRPGPAEAHAWGTKSKVSAEAAAFVNAALAHSRQTSPYQANKISAIRDDMHLESCSHIGSIVISAATALAQRDHWSGEQLVRSVVAGYEMAALLGTAIRASGNFNPHFRPSGLVGAFGAASAAIAGYGCSEDVAVSALGFALNAACGLNEWAWAGGLEIFAEMGTASRSGVQSYDLADAGLHCSDTVLEGRDGMFQALGVGSSGAETFRDWIARSGIGKGIMDVRFKPVAGCNFAQTPLAAALKLRLDRPLDTQKIIVTATSQAVKYPGCDNAGPLENIQQSKMSIQYGVCAALIFGRLDEEVFSKVDNHQIAGMMGKCEVKASSQFDQEFQKGLQPAQVEVLLADGTRLCQNLDDVPWLNPEEVNSRVRVEMARFLTEDKVVSLLTALDQLKVPGQVQDVSKIFAEIDAH
ncbi:hypothetical protein H2202_005736 [Exophiala xenobiotica]|nr:hypothetical protein H2202_005736 [Exophiala xenobiotica]KAK5419490.1 hypothetical protein LTR90_004554 [Exophiala xenobiotica]KAK5466981.1 hypothetical protein LTR20_003929 [Exophiala xenobiotica]KAK5509045.1 hypothetical protein LTR07_010556 [Exophiala xenobiotica]